MRDGFLRGSRYSPGNMDRESLEALFVGRDDVMQSVLSRIMKSVRSTHKHYILLVGPRGSGKTHLLALAYHLLMDRIDSAKARDKVVVALLNEEEWGVASFLDLVVRILNALASQAPELIADIDDIRDRFSKDPAGAEAFAVARLRQHTHGKTLLLLCENLADLFDGLGEEGQQRWRATIQEDGNWAVVASTPSLFAGVALQDNPFYGFFTIRALDKIDFDTGLDLLAKKAVHESKTELADFLRQPLGRARVRAIHHLAAGNYRAYVVLFDFLDKESLDDLVRPFMEMVDDLTPYYQERMRQLPPAQRKIIEFLCRQGRPATIKDISTPCLMSHQTAAKQIGELAAAGFVTRTRTGRNTFCELSEPLMRICIEVKDNKTQHFRLFVEFLRHWFTNSELEKRHVELESDDSPAVVDRLHVAEAIRSALADKHDPVVEALGEEAMRAWSASDYSSLATISEKLMRDASGTVFDYTIRLLALIETSDVRTAIAIGQEAVAEHPHDADIRFLLACALYRGEQFAKAIAALDGGIAMDHIGVASMCLRSNVLRRLERFEEAIEEARAVLDIDPKSVLGHSGLASSLLLSGQSHEAIDVAARLIEIDPAYGPAHYVRGRAFIELDRPADAVSAFDELLGTSDCRSLLLAASSIREVGDDVAAHRYLDGIAALQPDNLGLWIGRMRLHVDQRDFAAAAESAAKIEALPGKSLLGRLFMAQVRAATESLTTALEVLGEAVEPREFESEEDGHIAAAAGILTSSLRSFGPQHLPEGLAKLRDLMADQLQGGVIGRVLANFLKENVADGFAGPLDEWEQALEGIATNLADLSDCRIPVEMLRSAVTYTKTGDVKRLLSLPLEQRQLLEGLLPSDVGEGR